MICCSPRPDEFKNPKTEPLSSIFAWVSHFSWNRGSRTKKSKKIFFCLRMAGNGQKQCVLTFFGDFWVYLLLLSSLKIFDFSWWPTFNSHELGFYLRNRFRSDIIITLKVERTKPFWWILNDELHVFLWIRLLFAFTCDPYNKKRYKRGSLQKQDSVWIQPVKVFHPSARNIRWEKHDIGIFWMEFFGY